MTLSDKTLAELQQLLAQNPELLAQVQTVHDPAQAATLIAQAAAHKGLTISAAELTAHFAASAPTGQQALSDAQLDLVAGGGTAVDAVFMSIFTLGIGCAVVSIQTSIENSKGGKLGACTFK